MATDTLERTNEFQLDVAFEGDDMVLKHTFFDKAKTDFNQRVYHENVFHNKKLAIHHDEDLRGVVSCPSSTQWVMFQTEYPKLYNDLYDKDETVRVNAVKSIQIVHPDWVKYLRH